MKAYQSYDTSELSFGFELDSKWAFEIAFQFESKEFL